MPSQPVRKVKPSQSDPVKSPPSPVKSPPSPVVGKHVGDGVDLSSIKIESRATGLSAVTVHLYGEPGTEVELAARTLDLYYQIRAEVEARETGK